MNFRAGVWGMNFPLSVTPFHSEVAWNNSIITTYLIEIIELYNNIKPKNVSINQIDKQSVVTFNDLLSPVPQDPIVCLDIPIFLWEAVFLKDADSGASLTSEEFKNLISQLFSSQADIKRLALKVLMSLNYEYNFIKYTIITHQIRHDMSTVYNTKNKKRLKKFYQTCEFIKNEMNENDGFWLNLKVMAPESLLVNIFNMKKHFVYQFLNSEMYKKMAEKYIDFVNNFYEIGYNQNLGFSFNLDIN